MHPMNPPTPLKGGLRQFNKTKFEIVIMKVLPPSDNGKWGSAVIKNNETLYTGLMGDLVYGRLNQ